MLKTKEFILVDGQVINDEFFHEMSITKFILEGNSNYFKIGSEKKANFVGFIELNNDNDECIRLWSFPKEYYGNNNEKNPSVEEKRLILGSIKTTSKYNEKIIGNGSNSFTNINAIIDIVDYYNRYGIYKEVDKVHQNNNKGRINWSKTIKKKKPIVSNNNVIYDSFIVKKKCTNETIVSQAMAYVLKEVAPSYDFLFKAPLCKETYDKQIFTNFKYVVSFLQVEMNKTFKDIDKKLINALLIYFASASGSNMSVNLATSNYNLVWEEMVKHVVGAGKKTIEVGTNNVAKPYNIEPDHLDSERCIIADSKYYTYKEQDGLDYKQLFYFYHIVTRNAIISGNCADVIELHKKWNNYLIKPRFIEMGEYMKDVHILRKENEVGDFMNIYNIYVHPKKLIELFTNEEKRDLSSFK